MCQTLMMIITTKLKKPTKMKNHNNFMILMIMKRLKNSYQISTKEYILKQMMIL